MQAVPRSAPHSCSSAVTSLASWRRLLSMRLGSPLEPEVHRLSWHLSGSNAAGARGVVYNSATVQSPGCSLSHRSTSLAQRVRVCACRSAGNSTLVPARQAPNRAMAKSPASSRQTARRLMPRWRRPAARPKARLQNWAWSSAGANVTVRSGCGSSSNCSRPIHFMGVLAAAGE
ncbi:hypothetical protein D3C81_1295770 [compost metagenome]